MKPNVRRPLQEWLAAYTLLALTMALTACENKIDTSPLEPKLFAKIYTEMVVQTMDSTSIDSLSHFIGILSRHAVTQEQFDGSQNYFENHPDLWLEVLGHVETNLTKIKADRENPMTEPPADSLK